MKKRAAFLIIVFIFLLSIFFSCHNDSQISEIQTAVSNTPYLNSAAAFDLSKPLSREKFIEYSKALAESIHTLLSENKIRSYLFIDSQPFPQIDLEFPTGTRVTTNPGTAEDSVVYNNIWFSLEYNQSLISKSQIISVEPKFYIYAVARSKFSTDTSKILKDLFIIAGAKNLKSVDKAIQSGGTNIADGFKIDSGINRTSDGTIYTISVTCPVIKVTSDVTALIPPISDRKNYFETGKKRALDFQKLYESFGVTSSLTYNEEMNNDDEQLQGYLLNSTSLKDNTGTTYDYIDYVNSFIFKKNYQDQAFFFSPVADFRFKINKKDHFNIDNFKLIKAIIEKMSEGSTVDYNLLNGYVNSCIESPNAQFRTEAYGCLSKLRIFVVVTPSESLNDYEINLTISEPLISVQKPQ